MSTNIKSVDHFRTVTAEDEYPVVYVYTKWCYFCKLMSPLFERAAAAKKFGGIRFYKIDAAAKFEGLADLLEEYGIQGYPHILTFRNGRTFCKIGGYTYWKDFEEILSFYHTFNISGMRQEFTIDEPQDDNSYNPIKAVEWHDAIDKITTLLGPTNTILLFCVTTAPYMTEFPKYINKHLGHHQDSTLRIRVVKLDSHAHQHQYFIESNLLTYRPYVMMFRKEEMWSTYNFRMDERGSIERWLIDALDSVKIMDSAFPLLKSHVIPLDTVKNLNKKVSTKKPAVVLFYDDTAYSQAMRSVYSCAGEDHRKTKFYEVDYVEHHEFTNALDLEEGPSIAIYCEGHLRAETKIPMTLPNLKSWLLQNINQLPTSHSMDEKYEAIDSFHSPNALDIRSLSPRLSTRDSASFDRPSSRFSHHSYRERLSSLFHSREASHSTMTLSQRIQCQGNFEHRRERSFLRRLLFSAKHFFQDTEHGCVVISEPAREGIQIGLANQGGSYFNITLRPQASEDQLKIPFGVEFGPDRTEKARFTSASLSITFGYDDANGHAQKLKIREISPKDVKGDSTTVHRTLGTTASLGLSAGYSGASISTQSGRNSDLQYSRNTAPRVSGHGQYSDTATWTFEEDEGEAGRHGLEASYDLEVVLIAEFKTDVREIWMTFWGKACLAIGKGHSIGGKQTLLIGSMEKPYKRILDLRSQYCYPAQEGYFSTVGSIVDA